MQGFFNKHVLGHPLVLYAVGAVGVIALGSGLYYYSNAQAPSPYIDTAVASSTTITASGTVTPSENPDLAFETAGRVAVVSVAVGQTVSKGATLAALDTAALSAARSQAAANVRAAEARLALLQAGPRQTDVSVRQTAVDQAKQTLANLYAQVPNDLSAAYSANLGAVHADTDSLFNSPGSQSPTLAFTTSDTQAGIDVGTARETLNNSLITWGSAIANLGTDPASLEAALADSMVRLNLLRTYTNLLTEALAGAIVNSTFTASSISTANTNLAALRASISSSLSTLQADTQQIASDKLAITSATDALNQTLAGATSQDVEAAGAAVDAAQASLAAAEAALNNAIVSAPFSGTVASVQVKVGDLVSPNTLAVSLTPQSALEVDAFLSEADAARVRTGDDAAITLDAYGAGRSFPATVVSVDRAPTMQHNIPAYKVTLQFDHNDPAISSGMTANVTLTPHQ